MTVDSSVTPDPTPTPAPPAANGDQFFTKADIDAAMEKARQQEKDKVYGRLTSLQEQVQQFNSREEQRAAEEAAARQAAEADQRKKAEEEMSAKELLQAREQEWESRFNSLQTESEKRLEEIQRQREQERALLEKEREFATLSAYTQRRVAEESDHIAPQLVDFISGSTTEEIERSLAVAKAKSQEIAEQARAALQAAQAQQRGVSLTGYAPVGPMEVEGGSRQYSAADIQNMDIAEYSKFRQSIPGLVNGSNQNRGMFG